MSDRVVDQELVERVQAGDKRAFDLLVLKYQRKVQRLVSRFVRDSGEVDDVVQEAFIKAYRALPTFRGDAAFYTWIYRIAINCAKNYLASPGRRIVPMSDLISDDDDDAESFDRNEGLHDVATPDAEYATKQIGETVNRAMAALPEDLRMAVTLREIEGLSYEEIATAMNCPVG
ncbi:MAG TPA: RNA polymerase sigma factor RpoE, partial [Casimicrobium sp.]|nr:RNA polymerase sigma factor RpoE [Casimicrobium sp.]